MNKTFRHLLGLLVSVGGAVVLVYAAWSLAKDEWTVREGGWTYDPWYEKQCLRAVVTLWICDVLRQITFGRIQHWRLVIETALLIAAYIFFRLSFVAGPSSFPRLMAYGMAAVISGCAIASVVSSAQDILLFRQVLGGGEKKRPNKTPQTTTGSSAPDRV